MNPLDRRIVSAHEAGHAVVARVLGIDLGVPHAMLLDDGGITRIAGCRRPSDQASAQRFAIFTAAGKAAERLLFPRRIWAAAARRENVGVEGSDILLLIDLASRFGGDDVAHCQQWIQHAGRRATAILACNFAALAAAARYLNAWGELRWCAPPLLQLKRSPDFGRF